MNLIYKAELREEVQNFELSRSFEWIPPKYRQENRLMREQQIKQQINRYNSAEQQKQRANQNDQVEKKVKKQWRENVQFSERKRLKSREDDDQECGFLLINYEPVKSRSLSSKKNKRKRWLNKKGLEDEFQNKSELDQKKSQFNFEFRSLKKGESNFTNLFRFKGTIKNFREKFGLFKGGWEKIPLYDWGEGEYPKEKDYRQQIKNNFLNVVKKGVLKPYVNILDKDEKFVQGQSLKGKGEVFEKIKKNRNFLVRGENLILEDQFNDDNLNLSSIHRSLDSLVTENSILAFDLWDGKDFKEQKGLKGFESDYKNKQSVKVEQKRKLREIEKKAQDMLEEQEKKQREIQKKVKEFIREKKKSFSEKGGMKNYNAKMGEEQFGIFENKANKKPNLDLAKELKQISKGVQELLKEVREGRYDEKKKLFQDEEIMKEIKQMTGTLDSRFGQKVERILERTENETTQKKFWDEKLITKERKRSVENQIIFEDIWGYQPGKKEDEEGNLYDSFELFLGEKIKDSKNFVPNQKNKPPIPKTQNELYLQQKQQFQKEILQTDKLVLENKQIQNEVQKKISKKQKKQFVQEKMVFGTLYGKKKIQEKEKIQQQLLSEKNKEITPKSPPKKQITLEEAKQIQLQKIKNQLAENIVQEENQPFLEVENFEFQDNEEDNLNTESDSELFNNTRDQTVQSQLFQENQTKNLIIQAKMENKNKNVKASDEMNNLLNEINLNESEKQKQEFQNKRAANEMKDLIQNLIFDD